MTSYKLNLLHPVETADSQRLFMFDHAVTMVIQTEVENVKSL